jgi:hypothetical protein
MDIINVVYAMVVSGKTFHHANTPHAFFAAKGSCFHFVRGEVWGCVWLLMRWAFALIILRPLYDDSALVLFGFEIMLMYALFMHLLSVLCLMSSSPPLSTNRRS